MTVDQIHEAVDARAARLAARHRERLVCRSGCFDCCVDDVTVFEIEAEKIRNGAAELLANGTPHAAGRCAFLGEAGECRVYALRPYVCRTQGLPLRWIDDDAEAEYRDICALNEEGEAIESLAAEDCWTLGETEEQLARLQLASTGDLRRVRLRDLFRG
ncbi:MAG TPA: YkgJ family cysteine cluster protein [Thermoanaerobaculia bacterium]|nr:YkgJ family cysteine cluster protein [Thermoanaerobaculia bacterium]